MCTQRQLFDFWHLVFRHWSIQNTRRDKRKVKLWMEMETENFQNLISRIQYHYCVCSNRQTTLLDWVLNTGQLDDCFSKRSTLLLFFFHSQKFDSRLILLCENKHLQSELMYCIIFSSDTAEYSGKHYDCIEMKSKILETRDDWK